MQIRDALVKDFGEITAIYNAVLETSTAIYNDRRVTPEERITWWLARQEQGYPVLVASEGNSVLGFASFGDFRTGSGYRFTVEGTIHLHSAARGRGVGKDLLTALVNRAEALGKHTLMAGVDSENIGSLRFLERFGFKQTGCLREVGFKFGRYLDLVLLQYWITAPTKPLNTEGTT